MHRITESLTELLWELYSVILVEELPNRNCFGINSVIFLCAMVFSRKIILGKLLPVLVFTGTAPATRQHQ